MNKRFWAIIGVVIVAFVGMLLFFAVNRGEQPVDYGRYRRDVIKKLASEIDYSQYNPDTVIAADENNGEIAEKMVGDENAPVVIYEYADYACSHCAEFDRQVSQILADYDGKVALVFRGFVLQFPNSMITGAAANAAAIQGYWKEYKDLLFANQNEWYEMRGAEIKNYLEELFKEASDGKGDVEKFRGDMASEAVAKRMAFDYGLGEKVGLTGTPTFRVSGEAVGPTELRAVVQRMLQD